MTQIYQKQTKSKDVRAQNNEPVVLPSVVAASMTLLLASGFLNS